MVSVIIPCYNCAQTIDNTLHSLERQSYRDFEVLCINDGSTDSTKELLEQWKTAGTLNMRIIHKENGGVSSARNCGIDAAEGKYITFLDADDEYHGEFLARLVEGIEKYDADTAYCRLDKERNNVVNSAPPVVTKQTQEEAMHNLLYRLAEFGFYCYIYRRSIIERANVRFELGVKFGEDREFAWKYLCHCETASFVDAPMYWYQIMDGSAINGKASWRRTDSLYAVKRTEKYMQAHNVAFLPHFQDYMFQRDMWAVAKKFAVTQSKDLYKRLQKEFDVRVCMKRTAKDANKLVAIASWCYLIHPMLFYFVVRLKK